jgi:hypothetical protein
MPAHTKLAGHRHLGLTGLRFTVDSARSTVCTAPEFNMDAKPLPALLPGCMHNPNRPVRTAFGAQFRRKDTFGLMDFE